MMVMLGSGGGVRTIINYVRSTKSYDETQIKTRNALPHTLTRSVRRDGM